MEKTTQRGALCSVRLTQYYLADKIKKKRFVQGCGGGGDMMERGRLEDLGVYGKIKLKWIFKK